MIQIVVFDDNVTSYGEAIYKATPPSVSIYGSIDALQWHPEWNALGDYAKAVGKNNVKLESNEVFNAALEWCKTLKAEDRAIVFCDYMLRDIEVTEAQVASVGKAALEVGNSRNTIEARDFFNKSNQGLLLAAALASNEVANVDIWLATANAVKVSDHLFRLKKWERASLYVNKSDDSITKTFNAARNVEQVRRAVNEYSERRNLVDPGFWPDQAAVWFSDTAGSAAVPHHHPEFVALLDDGGCVEVVNYLIRLGASEATAKKWLHQPGCHSALVHFLGGCAAAHNGRRSLTLGSLLFPLLKATPNSDWAESIEWISAVRPILAVGTMSSGKTASRRMILSAYELFSRLYSPLKAGEAHHKVRAEFLSNEDGFHLVVDFEFDCSLSELLPGDNKFKPSLLTKLLLLPWCREMGEMTAALARFLESTIESRNNYSLFTSVYPVRHENELWTRLDFKADS